MRKHIKALHVRDRPLRSWSRAVVEGVSFYDMKGGLKQAGLAGDILDEFIIK